MTYFIDYALSGNNYKGLIGCIQYYTACCYIEHRPVTYLESECYCDLYVGQLGPYIFNTSKFQIHFEAHFEWGDDLYNKKITTGCPVET